MKNTFLRSAPSKTDFSDPLLFNANPSETSGSINLYIKRIYDVAISMFTLIFICSWLFPLVAIFIKISSKGPVFFKQLRNGKNNVPFYCYKFRTMILNENADILQAKKDDHRVTRFGLFLRRSSLDELPQLINVLKGEMSIVGPRPHAVPMNEVFSKEIPGYMYRHSMKPGLTGLAQSKGFRGEIVNYHDLYSRYRLDMFYIKNWCLYFDFIIIFWTAYCLLFKNNKAY